MQRRELLTTGLAALGTPALVAQPAPRKGRLKQSVTGGVFGRGNKMTMDERCREAARLGVSGYDLVGPADFPILKKHGLAASMVRGGGILTDNINHQANHAKMEPEYRKAIEDAAAFGAPNVIVLSGNRRGIADEEGLANCVTFLNRIKAQAEEKNVTLCMELLNSKVNHPDYQCDRTWWGVELCKRVNSSRVKLLYDIYHMQIMEGDIIRTIQKNIEYIAHFHTAGNPGRHEMDDTQEMNYRGIAKAIADLGFKGYVAHEYSPLGDPLTSLQNTLEMFEV
ncbi:MAG TPA: TIM barrel protein [Bryobacteraceae bacterium]|nr:TIM barrel protein [Bryobacteraceae bacterium]